MLAFGQPPAGWDASAFTNFRRLLAASRQAPNDAGIATDLALNYFLLGQRQLFREAIARALVLDPGSAQAYYLTGRFALESEQNPKEASAALRKALELAPSSFKAHYYLGICLRQLGQFAAAREQFQKAGESSSYSWPFRNLAELELELNRFSAALAPALKAIELEPTSAENCLVAGKAYQALGQAEKAIPLYQRAASLDPLWEKPHFLLGNLYLARAETRPLATKELEVFQQLNNRQRSAGGAEPGLPRQAPQARTPAELDSFGSILLAADSLAVIRAGEGFLSRFPNSEFRGRALEAEFEAFRQRNDYGAARRVAKDILELNPSNALVLSHAACLIAEAGDMAAFPSADDYAARAIASANATLRPESLSRAEFFQWKGSVLAFAYAAEGLLALRRRQPDDAVLRLQRAIEARPAPDGSDHLRLAEAYALKGDVPRAREAFRRAESIGPEPVAEAARKQAGLLADPPGTSAGAQFQRARALEKEGKLPEAAAAYEIALRADSSVAEAWHNLGLLYYRMGDYARSAERLREALRRKPDLAASHLFLGLALFRLGEFQDSAHHLEAALEAGLRNREAYLFLLRDQIALSRFRPETAEEALRRFPDEPELNYTAGLACLERIREIARAADEAGAASPEFLWLSLRRAEERQQTDAVDKYRRHIAALPEPPAIREYDILAAMSKRYFDAVLARDPDSPQAHSILGYLHESRGELEEALAAYRQAADHFAAGRLLAQNVRLKEAEQEFQAAVAADPQNDRAKADLARLYLQQDQPEKALATLLRIVERYPRDAYAWADLGKAQGKLGAPDQAVHALRKALELDPSLNQVHYQLAMLYRQQGQEKLAQEELAKFRASRRANP
jgi:tetratricopeptide (TPR) repeat protein